MKLLSISQYSIAIEAIKSIDINHLFALAVAEEKIDGRIFVDDTDHPTTFLVYHPYGMSMLFGDETNAGFNAGLLSYALNKDNTRTKTEWLQAYPSSWNKKLAELFEHNIIAEEDVAGNEPHDKIELSTRVNFNFNKEAYLGFKESFRFENNEMVRTDKELFEKIEGTVVPKYFWRNADDFNQHAVAFSILYKGKPASTAFYSKSILLITAVVFFLLNVIVGPIVEELFFRGYLTSQLSRFGIWAPVIVTVLFSLYHFWLPFNNLFRIAIFLPAAYLAWKEKNIYISIVFHCLCNLFSTISFLLAL